MASVFCYGLRNIIRARYAGTQSKAVTTIMSIQMISYRDNHLSRSLQHRPSVRRRIHLPVAGNEERPNVIRILAGG